MKKLTTAFVFVFVQLLLFGQNSDWIIAPNFLKFPMVGNNPPSVNTLPTDPSGYQGQPATGGQNIITDTEGKIVFFIVDENIYSRKGKLIDVFGDSSPEPYHYHIDGYGTAIAVVPDPKDCNLFHLFSTSEGNSVSLYDSYYAKLRVAYDSEGELTENSGLILNDIQDCESKYINLSEVIGGSFNEVNNTHDEQIRFTVAPKNDNDEFKMFVSNGARMFVLTIDENGLSYSGNFLDFQVDFNIYEDFRQGIEIEAIRLSDSDGNYRVAHPISHPSNTGGNRYGIAIYDFTPDGIYIPSSYKFLDYGSSDEFIWQSSVNSTNFRGLEFSPSGDKIFVSHQRYIPTGGSTLDYWDLTGTLEPIPLSNSIDFYSSQIEADVNGELIIPRDNYLAKISTPDGTPSLDIDAISIPYYPGSIWSSDVFSTQPLRLLQNQIDGMDYSMIEPNVYDAVEYEATGAATWKPNTIADTYNNNPLIYGFGSITYIEKELRIKAGSNIRIENMTLKFAPGARLIIENGENGQQGGKLTLLNTVLINDERCDKDSLWLGVEVWGNQNANQGSVFNTTQGVLRMFGTSRIENAHIGALIGKRSVDVISIELFDDGCDDPTGDYLDIEVIIPNSYDDNRNGGIIQANSGSVFFNNKQGVFFRKHLSLNGANNISFFTRTTFTWDGPLKENSRPRDHIKMDQVKGINIRACAFNQLSPELYNVNNQGYGINATLSQFYVNSQCNGLTTVGQPCPSYTPTTFTNLRFGVFAYFANSALSFTVNESEFNNCRYGIYSSRSQNARVTNNEFNVREETYQTAGCLFDYSDGYKIEGNTFQEQDNASIPNGQGNSYGVWINNSGVLHNEVYRNTFRNLKVGGQSDRLNGAEEGDNNDLTSGLKWKCNTFLNNIYTADLGVNGVIDKEQGTVNASTAALAQERAARNVFSIAANTGTEHDIMMFNYPSPFNVYPNQQSINYVHLNNPFHIANDVDNLVVPQYAQFGGYNVVPFGNTCPSKLGSTSPIKKSKMAFHKSEITNLYTQIDGGNTSDLLDKATNFANENTTYQALMDASPYLSDEVLLAYIENSTISGKTKNVVVANSQLSPSVYQAVMQANLPNGVKNSITNTQDQVSERQLLYSEIKWNSDEYAYYFNDLTSELLLDTTELADYTPLINELNQLDDKLAKVQLLDVYLELKDATLTTEIRDELDSLENPDYIELTIAIQELNDGLSNEKELNENETLKNQFINLKNNASCGMVSNSAKNILSCVFGVEDAPDFLPLQASSNIGMIYSTNEENTSEREIFEVKVSMYPNPSTGQVYFDLPDFEEGTMQIQLFDVTGKEVYSVNYFNTNGELVDFTALKKGTYIVRITLGNDYNESHLLQLND